MKIPTDVGSLSGYSVYRSPEAGFPLPPPSAVRLPARRRLARNHHVGGLDDRERIVAPPEFQLLDRVPGDDGGQELIAHPQADLSHEAVEPHFLG